MRAKVKFLSLERPHRFDQLGSPALLCRTLYVTLCLVHDLGVSHLRRVDLIVLIDIKRTYDPAELNDLLFTVDKDLPSP